MNIIEHVTLHPKFPIGPNRKVSIILIPMEANNFLWVPRNQIGLTNLRVIGNLDHINGMFH